MSFGKKLYELRKQKGLSEEDLAVDLNISQSSISNYEQNFTKPDIVFLEKVSLYFKIPIEDFLQDIVLLITVTRIKPYKMVQ
ncbi:MAG: helix-turn-helix transcriptional regulator [Chitinophagaceae bacterium]|nr:helix-turn-helix transcriptional regulator [Chitinophagaceae bacterium]